MASSTLHVDLHVDHAENRRLILFWDLMRVAKRLCPHPRGQTKAFANFLRVSETFYDDRVKYLLEEKGMAEEDIDEEHLWFDLFWPAFMYRVQEQQSQRSLENALPKVIEKGFIRQRYIRRDSTGTPICDEAGDLLIYETYQEAQQAIQKRETISHQILFLAGQVNEAIRKEYKLPTPPKKESRGAHHAKARNPRSTEQPQTEAQHIGREGTQPQEESSLQTIPQVRTDAEGGTHRCVPGELTSEAACAPLHETARTDAPGGPHENTNGPHTCEEGVRTDADNNNSNCNNVEQILLNQSITDVLNPLSGFDFSQKYAKPAILDLFKRLLPPLKDRYKTEEERLARERDWKEAARVLAEDAFFQQLGLRYLARTIAYMSLPDSKCKWLAYIRADNPGVIIRPWHLTKKDKKGHRLTAQRCAWEMEESNWWPSFLPDPATTPPAEESPTQIDLFELLDIPPEERVGMDRALAEEWEVYLREELSPHGYEVVRTGIGHRYSGRGYALEIWYDNGQSIRFYSPGQWDRLLEVSEVAQLGSQEFIETLSAALRAEQVA